jgi:hypothetical protein
VPESPCPHAQAFVFLFEVNEMDDTSSTPLFAKKIDSASFAKIDDAFVYNCIESGHCNG